jgi:hypothetical protein
MGVSREVESQVGMQCKGVGKRASRDCPACSRQPPTAANVFTSVVTTTPSLQLTGRPIGASHIIDFGIHMLRG